MNTYIINKQLFILNKFQTKGFLEFRWIKLLNSYHNSKLLLEVNSKSMLTRIVRKPLYNHIIQSLHPNNIINIGQC